MVELCCLHMKKKILTYIFFTTITMSLFAANGLKLYRSIDIEYKKVKTLCLEAQVVYPAATPVSGTELLYALDRIPEEKRTDEWIKIYEAINDKDYLLDTDESRLDFTSTLNLETYFHKKDMPRKFFIHYKDIPPMLSLFGELEVRDNFYLYIDFIEKDPNILEDNHTPYGNYSTLLDYHNGKFKVFNYLTQSYQPFRAGLSIGTDNFNFQIGRNSQSLGRGIAGNMFISDNFSMQEYIKFSWYTKYFSYILDLTHFDQQIDLNTFEQFSFSGQHQNRIVHTFLITPTNFLEMSLSVGAMFQTDSPFDFRMISPLSIVHSYNNFSENRTLKPGDEGNNYLAAEISWSFLPGWIIDAQIGMDQFQTSYESTENLPNAFGFLLNLQNSKKLKNGHLTSYLESAYTTPYLYLNDKKNEDNSQNHNYDYILGYYISNSSEIGYSGYPFGPDSIVIILGTEYRTYNRYIGFDYLHWIRGEHGIGAKYQTLAEYNQATSRNTPFADYPQHFINISAKGGYRFINNFEIGGSIGVNWLKNMDNIKDNDRFDVVGSLRFSFSF